MGSGKSSSIINMMNENSEDNFVYITPYLDEVKRIKSNCSRKFYEPVYYIENKVHTRKFDALHTLLANERNIASTHALFKKANRETRELIKNGEYILVLDEVMDVVEQLQMKKHDLETLFAMELLYEDDGFLLWNEDKIDWDSRYNDIRDMALNRNLIKYKDQILIWTFPADIFESFKEVYVLTYQFEAQIQKYYYDLFNIDYEYWYAQQDEDKVYRIHKRDDTYTEEEFRKRMKGKIHVLDHKKLNLIGEDEFALSKSWYMKSSDALYSVLKKNTENFFKNIVNTQSNDNMWTTYKDYQDKLKGKGYTKGFVSLNARATNEFKHKKSLAYLINRYPNTIVSQFMRTKGIVINSDMYALSEMLQWIFRSQIRDDEEITVYVPSSRMRNLLIDWLNYRV